MLKTTSDVTLQIYDFIDWTGIS